MVIIACINGVEQQINNSNPSSAGGKTYLVTEDLSHIGLFHDLSPPVAF